MTLADRNELIDRATRVALLDGAAYTVARDELDEYLVSRVSIRDLLAIRVHGPFTVGQRLICDIIDGWPYRGCMG